MAIDKIYLVKDFRLDQVFRPERVFPYGGGKGVNVARVIKTLGEEPLVLGFVGGKAGKFIANDLKEEGIPTEFVHSQRESRTCVLIIDPEKHTTTIINEKGPTITKDELSQLITKFKILVKKADLVILSGSLPLGVPTDFFARLIRIAKKFAKRVILDTSGEALKKGIEARPFMVKPNLSEFQNACGSVGPYGRKDVSAIGPCGHKIPTRTEQQLGKEIKKLNHSGIKIVGVTLGKEGMLVGYQGKIYSATPPEVKGISSVGSGDAVTAGFAVGVKKGLKIEKTIGLAVASGAANTLVLGSGRCFRKHILRLKQKVKIVRCNYAS